MYKRRKTCRKESKPPGNTVGFVNLPDLTSVDFHKRRWNTDERTHGNAKHGHGLDQCLLGFRHDRSKNASHHRKEQKRHQIAGHQKRSAADIHPKL